MQSTSYEFTARAKPGPERPKLMSGWTLAGFAVLVCIPLVMIFPKKELLEQASQQRLGDLLTINYLSNLLKTEPNNLDLRLLLADHKIFLDDLADIPALVQPALDSTDPEWQTKGLLAEYKYLTRLFVLTPKDSPQLSQLLERRRAIFFRLANRSWDVPTLIYLAGQADQLHERGLATLIYQSISDASESAPLGWFVASAKRALSAGDFQLAAHLYFIARHRTYLRDRQREYLIAGLRALMSGGLYEQAMQQMDRQVGDLEDDSDTLYELIHLARAANDQLRAVRYTKRLLHMSQKEQPADLLARFNFNWLGIGDANAASEQPEFGTDSIRPYNEKSYQLAYDVFVGNGKLADAMRVAEAAVRQVPKQTIWHKRLAQTAGWNNKPEIALREWKWILHHGGGQDALRAVLQLAPGQDDYDALLDAWQRVAATQKLDVAQWNNLSSLFEQTGQQEAGIKFFERRYAVDHLTLQLEIAARLAERSGDDARATDLYLRLLKNHGFNSGWLIKIANLYLNKGEYRKAYDLLQKNSANIDAKDAVYWKAMADLAWQLQLDSDARKDYRHLAESGNLAREDFSRLIYLLDDTQQQEKAALAEMAYNRFADLDMLLRALDIYATTGDLQAQKRLFASVAGNPKVHVSDSARFFMLRAQYFQASGEFNEAREDFRHAAAIAPDDANTGNALLWFMIDARDLPALREMIARIVARGDQQDPAYWGVLAAAYQALDQPSRAVAYYGRQLKHGGQDFLWLVNYADALEQDQQAGMAARVRRHAWLQLQKRLAGKPVKPPFSADMQAAARLALLNAPGDPSLNLVRLVLRQDRLLNSAAVTNRKADDMELGWATAMNKRDAAADRMVDELALGWAMSTEQSANAKAWLWQRYGQSLNRPLWADTSVALAENDTTRLDKLLAEQGDGMSMLVRHDVALAVGQDRYAQSIVFDDLTQNPYDEEAQSRLTEDALAYAGYVEFGLQHQQIASLYRNIQSTRLEMPLTQQVRFGIELWNTRQGNDVLPDFGPVPPTEKIAGIFLRNHGSLGDTGISVQRRNELANTTEVRIDHAMNVLPRIELELGAEFNADAPESTDLLVFGMRSQLRTAVTYTFNKRDYVNVEPGWVRYYTQTGQYLGNGDHISWELGHQFRTEYPDWKVWLTGTHVRFNSAANTTLPLPDNQNVYGLCTGFGQTYQLAYTQAWRPFTYYCATDNNLSGQGYNAQFGLAGSVAGHDRLGLSVSLERGGVNLVDGLSRELKLSYRYFY